MKNQLLAVFVGLFVFNCVFNCVFNVAEASDFNAESKLIDQKLKGEYKTSSGNTVILTADQVAIMLRGESLKVDDKTNIQFTKKQLEHKEELSPNDIAEMLRGNKPSKKH